MKVITVHPGDFPPPNKATLHLSLKPMPLTLILKGMVSIFMMPPLPSCVAKDPWNIF